MVQRSKGRVHQSSNGPSTEQRSIQRATVHQLSKGPAAMSQGLSIEQRWSNGRAKVQASSIGAWIDTGAKGPSIEQRFIDRATVHQLRKGPVAMSQGASIEQTWSNGPAKVHASNIGPEKDKGRVATVHRPSNGPGPSKGRRTQAQRVHQGEQRSITWEKVRQPWAKVYQSSKGASMEQWSSNAPAKVQQEQ